jgi:hypothetical protein
MAGCRYRPRVSLRHVAPRVGACVVLFVGVAIAAPAPASATAPGAPTIRSLIAGPAAGLMTMKWSSPHGASGVIGYDYRVQIDSGPFSLPAVLVSSPIKKGTAPCGAPAAAGHGCTYQIRATNGTPGAWSVAVGATWTLPSIPKLGRALAGPADGVATLSWREPKTSGGLPLSYQYQVNGGSGFSAPTTIAPGTIVSVPGRYPTLSAEVPCTITGPVSGCSYILNALNGVGASGLSTTRTAVLRKPGPPTDLQVFTSTVALGTGAAGQSLTWTAPTNVGGQAITDYAVFACATSTGSLCTNVSPGWVQFVDIFGNPPDAFTTHDCPANGRCAYEVWAKNPAGKGATFTFVGPAPPTFLQATASSTTTGQIDLSWFNPIDFGPTFGHFVLFECATNLACTNGEWTNVPADAAPWTRVDLGGAATVTSYACGTVTACEFRVGYVDGDGNIGGVSNLVTIVGT